MSQGRAMRRLRGHLLFALICALLVFGRMLPLDPAGSGWPGPDLMLCLALAWAARRPEDVPVWLLAPLFLAADLLLMRPPGLWTALVLLAVAAVRAPARGRGPSFAAEWARAAALLAAVTGAHWLVMALLLADQPPLWAQLRVTAISAAVYPAVAAALQGVLGIRRAVLPDGFGRGARA